MSPTEQFDTSKALPAPRDPVRTRSDIYAQHAPALFRLAQAICLDEEMASLAVAQAFHAAFIDTPRADENPRISHLLARLTYLACILTYPPPSDPTAQDPTAADTVTNLQRRALLALTTYGDHTCQEAATLLHIQPAAAAQALRTPLIGSTHAPTGPPHPSEARKVDVQAFAKPTQVPTAHANADMSPLTCVTVRPATGHDVVALTGELDLCTAPQLSPVIHGLLAEGRNHITINLDDVTFMDASALTALILTHRDISRSHGTLTITHNPLCARLLAITGLNPLFNTTRIARNS